MISSFTSHPDRSPVGSSRFCGDLNGDGFLQGLVNRKARDRKVGIEAMRGGVAVRHEQRERRVREVSLLERKKILVFGVVQDSDFERGFLEGGNAQFPAPCFAGRDIRFAGL